MLGSDTNQSGRCPFMQIVPPDGLCCFPNHRFIREYNFGQHCINMPIDTTCGPLQFRNQLCGIIFERTLCYLATEGTPQHDNLERTQFVAWKPFARQWFQDADQPATTALPGRNLFLFLGSVRLGFR